MRAEPFILHHYDESPYAEKVRLMLGFAGLSWQSVLSPVMPPRPITEPLAGGYRRIPIAQMGADVFCDSRLVALELANMTGLERLSPFAPGETARRLIRRAEGDVFFAAAGAAPPHVLLATVLRNFGLFGTLRFAIDRFHMVRSASSPPPQGRAALRLYNQFKSDLNDALTHLTYFSGDHPGYADAALYHVVWLNNQARRAPLSGQHPLLKRWYDQLAQHDHGHRHEADGASALAAARGADPRPLPESPPEDELAALLGRRVAVHPTDYLPTATAGQLAAVTRERIVLARQDEDLGLIHVHFPREGYALSPTTT